MAQQQIAASILNITLPARRAALTLLAILTVLTTLPTAQAQTFSVLHSFVGGDGANPLTGLTIDAAGNLYGTTEYGGSTSGSCSNRGCGTIFRLKRAESGFTLDELLVFTGSGGSGGYPLGRVSFGPDGALYGSTIETVFSLRPPATFCRSISCPWSETVLSTIPYQIGNTVSGDLAFDAAGNIYGTVEYGGYNGNLCNEGGCGAVYQLTNSGGTWTANTIYEFHGSDGEYPYSGVIFDHAGNMYGVTRAGAFDWGTVFELTPSSSGWVSNVLYRFQDGSDGADPWGGIIMDASGNIYGTTSNGGANNGGTVWEVSPSNGGWTFSPIYELAGAEGPMGKLVMDSAGNLYGSSVKDGANGYGSIFKLTPSNGGWTYTSLHDFTGNSDGAYPYDGLVLDAAGNIYGTTYGGGNYLCSGGAGCGLVWEITP